MYIYIYIYIKIYIQRYITSISHSINKYSLVLIHFNNVLTTLYTKYSH